MIPIPNAIDLVTAAVHSALAPLCGTYLGNPRCY